MRPKATLSWIGLALLGIVVAAAVAVAAGNLVSRQIGLSSEPISAGDALVPASVGKSHEGEQGGQATTPTTTAPPTTPPPETTVVTPPPPPAPTHEGGDDSGGGGHSGDGGGHGADD
jgi:hypothetical protein